MILYRIGEIIYKNKQNIIFESKGVGYSLIMPDSERIEQGQKMKLYLFEVRNDYYHATYAFKDFKERLLFIDLIGLSGIGPRVAFNMLNHGFERVAALIANGDSEALEEIPYINARVARLVIFELQKKWMKMINPTQAKEAVATANSLVEVKDALKMLGFKAKQIESALLKINQTSDVEQMIEEAIQLISKGYETASA